MEDTLGGVGPGHPSNKTRANMGCAVSLRDSIDFERGKVDLAPPRLQEYLKERARTTSKRTLCQTFLQASARGLPLGTDPYYWSQNGHERTRTRRTRRNGHRRYILIKTTTWTA
jgi:hypothetical protein